MIKKFRTAAFFSVAVILLLAACAVNKPNVRTPSAPLSHHTIGGKLFTSAWMQRSAEYQALCLQAYNIATERLDRAVDLNSRSEAPKKLAVITDIDETFLDNSPNSVHQPFPAKIMKRYHGMHGVSWPMPIRWVEQSISFVMQQIGEWRSSISRIVMRQTDQEHSKISDAMACHTQIMTICYLERTHRIKMNAGLPYLRTMK